MNAAPTPFALDVDRVTRELLDEARIPTLLAQGLVDTAIREIEEAIRWKLRRRSDEMFLDPEDRAPLGSLRLHIIRHPFLTFEEKEGMLQCLDDEETHDDVLRVFADFEHLVHTVSTSIATALAPEGQPT